MIHSQMTRATHLERWSKCPVPCGYYNQICCNSNEVCYTNEDGQPACRSLETPSDVTKTVTAGFTAMQTSLIKETEIVTTIINVSVSLHLPNATTQNSLVTLTTVKTSTELVPAPPATHPSTSSSTAQPSLESHTGWSTRKLSGVIGGLVGFIILLAAGLGFLLWRRRKKRQQIRDQKRDFDALQPDGAGNFRMGNTAQIRESPPARNPPSAVPDPSLLPPEQPNLNGPNPYDTPSPNNGPPWGPDDVVPPYPGSRSSTPRQASSSRRNLANSGLSSSRAPPPPRPQASSGSLRAEDQPYGAVPRPDASRRMPRRPIGSMQPTVHEYYEDHR